MVKQGIESFFNKGKLFAYKKRETILRADTPPLGVFYLKKGYVRDYSISKDGEELTLIIFKPGDFFPIQWVFNDKPNAHHLEAMTPVEVWRIPREDFLRFLRANPAVLFESMQKIVARLGGLLDRMEHLVFGNAYQKVASILVVLAERFGRTLPARGKKQQRPVSIPIPLTHRDIALLIGLTRETVSVEMKRLEDKAFIAYKKRFIHIHNIHGLRQESMVNSPSEPA